MSSKELVDPGDIRSSGNVGQRIEGVSFPKALPVAGAFLQAINAGEAIWAEIIPGLGDSALRADMAALQFEYGASQNLDRQDNASGITDIYLDASDVDATETTFTHDPASRSFELTDPLDVVRNMSGSSADGNVTLHVDRFSDGDLTQYAAVFWETDSAAGATWTASETITSLRFFNFSSNARIAGFAVELYDGTSWAKVPLTSWSDGAGAWNSDEAMASNANAWQTVGFAPVAALGARVRCRTVHNNGNNNACLSELQVHRVPSLITGELQSTAFPADVMPEFADFFLWEEDLSTLALNTDLVAMVSRNGGADWTTVTLSEIGSLSVGRHVGATDIDLSGQAPGTSMMYRIETRNGAMVRLHGANLQWRA